MIELQNLSKIYSSPAGDVEALRDVSLRIEDGEIFGIIGLSGAGKSTLVRCINLLERPTAGKVLIDGRDLTALPRAELRTLRTLDTYSIVEMIIPDEAAKQKGSNDK